MWAESTLPVGPNLKLWELGIRGRMWRVITNMYAITRSAVLLVLFSLNQLLDEVEKAILWV